MKYVLPSRHPWIGATGKKIIINGVALMERSQKITNAARQKEFDIATECLNAVLNIASIRPEEIKNLRGGPHKRTVTKRTMPKK